MCFYAIQQNNKFICKVLWWKLVYIDLSLEYLFSILTYKCLEIFLYLKQWAFVRNLF